MFAVAKATDARARALEKYPGIRLAPDDLEQFLAARHAEGASDDAGIEEDLCLAFACAQGDPKALVYVDRLVLSQVPKMLRHMRLADATVDDVQQELRVLLLVPKEGQPGKIADFGGRSPLFAWVRVSAIRLALRSSRKKGARAEVGDDEAIVSRESGIDEALLFLKDDQRRVFRDALCAAVAGLPADDVMRLRLHYIDGLSLDDLARLEGVHRATVARWLSKARESILAGTKEGLREGRLSESECVSLLGIAQSRFEWSLRMFSAPEPGSATPGPNEASPSAVEDT